MMLFGFLLVALGCVLVILAVFAEASHPTGGSQSAVEVMRDGGILAAMGAVVLLLGWLI